MSDLFRTFLLIHITEATAVYAWVVTFASCEPQRVCPFQWVWRILENIQSTRISNRILANKPPDLRIVVPISVIVQPVS